MKKELKTKFLKNPFKTGKYLNAWGRAFVAITLSKNDIKKIKQIYKSGILEKPISLENSLKWNKLWEKFQLKSKKYEIHKKQQKQNQKYMKTEKQIKSKKSRLLKDLKTARNGWHEALKSEKETWAWTNWEKRLEGSIDVINWILK